MTAPGCVAAWSVDPGDTLAGEIKVRQVYRDPDSAIVTVWTDTGWMYFHRTQLLHLVHRPYRPPIRAGWRIGVFFAWARWGRSRGNRWRSQHP